MIIGSFGPLGSGILKFWGWGSGHGLKPPSRGVRASQALGPDVEALKTRMRLEGGGVYTIR